MISESIATVCVSLFIHGKNGKEYISFALLEVSCVMVVRILAADDLGPHSASEKDVEKHSDLYPCAS